MKYSIYVLLAIFIFVGGLNTVNAQDSTKTDRDKSESEITTAKYEYQDVCGNPAKESFLWATEIGVVKRIIEDNSIVVKIDGKNKLMKLAGVSQQDNKKAINTFLKDNLLNKEVEILLKPNDLDSTLFYGIIQKNEISINRQLIEEGTAEFENNAGYTLGSYTSCVYQQVEKKAKAAKLGTWAK